MRRRTTTRHVDIERPMLGEFRPAPGILTRLHTGWRIHHETLMDVMIRL